MKILRRNFIILFTNLMLISGWGVWLLLTKSYPDNYFGLYPSIPFFFYAMGIALILLITREKGHAHLKTANLYLLLKVVKLLLSLLIIGLYFFLIKENRQTFALVFGGFYVMCLGLETYFFFRTEKELNISKLNE
jgi:hypothetical protein